MSIHPTLSQFGLFSPLFLRDLNWADCKIKSRCSIYLLSSCKTFGSRQRQETNWCESNAP
uniref:Alternative protein COL2A1 n=1 Tax=Homo sapiens TaxID=9606 RepID=L8EBB9_HUMAN|nr:alternative protein COL2A1 [Homo sapiens]